MFPDAGALSIPALHRLRRRSRRALTIAEVLVACLCLALLLGVMLVVLDSSGRGGQRGRAHRVKDMAQIRGIHQSWLVFAREFDGAMPTPGLTKRLPINGVEEPGRGEEDISQNTTANLHSMCIMLNYYSPEMCVSPSEPNPAVRVVPGGDYNFDLYKPASASYWDSSFTADLKTGSNVSYASMPIHGQLRDRHWRDRLGGLGWPMIGNRGPLNGVHDPNSFTLKIHAPYDQWSGNICFEDNSVEFLTGLPSATRGDGRATSTQGLFHFEGEDDADGILTFVKSMSPEGPEIQHD